MAITADEAEFFYRGQVQTVSNENELMVSEVATNEAEYAEAPSLEVALQRHRQVDLRPQPR